MQKPTNQLTDPSKNQKKEIADTEDKKESNQEKSKPKSTYDPKVFRASEYEPKYGRFQCDDLQKIKLTVTLKDIGLEGLDSFKSLNKQQNKQEIPPKSETKDTDDASKLDEQERMKKIQEEWELRKKLEKEIYTYDPEIFYESENLPTTKSRPEGVDPIKLTVELKDIGMGDFHTAVKNKQKFKQASPEEAKEKNQKKSADCNDDLSEDVRMRKIQEEWELRKDVEKHMNTYDPRVFRASAYSSKKKIKKEDIGPIKLTVELKDIGMEDFASNKTKAETKQSSHEKVKPKSQSKPKTQKIESDGKK